jgi:hypothetical protein
MSNEKIVRKTNGGAGSGVPAIAADAGQRLLVDTWDEPELEDPEIPTPSTDKATSEDSSEKKRKADQAPKSAESKPEGASADASATPTDLVILLPGADSGDGASAGPTKKRRSFCNFHYMTTQGGSTHAEPGEDTSMQSRETKTKKALTLLDFPEQEKLPTQLDIRPTS